MQPPFLQSPSPPQSERTYDPVLLLGSSSGVSPSDTTMRAFVVEEAGKGAVHQVERPHPGPGEAIVAVRQAGVCGTDIEFFRGAQLNLAMGTATFPLRLGHEWSGVVDRVGPDVDPSWIGARVIGASGCGDAIYVAPPAYGK
jgi:D-arabinose 1-dehydrogenase-like Zn-dependent alcohol dehydrogenase